VSSSYNLALWHDAVDCSGLFIAEVYRLPLIVKNSD